MPGRHLCLWCLTLLSNLQAKNRILETGIRLRIKVLVKQYNLLSLHPTPRNRNLEIFPFYAPAMKWPEAYI
jgi:hypothetical protein